MTRTAEQIEADRALMEAIARCRTAYMEPDDPPDVMTDYLVLVAATRIDGDGDETSVYDMLFRDGSMRDHAAYGLLKIGERFLIRMEDGEGV